MSAVPGIGINSIEQLRSMQFHELVVALLIPMALTVLSSKWYVVTMYLKKLWRCVFFEYVRVIEATESSDYWASYKSDDRNQVLQKAILLHIGEQKAINKQQHAQLRLMVPTIGGDSDGGSSDGDSDDGAKRSNESKASRQLRRLRITTIPRLNMRACVAPGVFLNLETVMENENRYSVITKHTFTLSSRKRDGQKLIDEFIDMCYNNYIADLKKDEDHSRYYFQMQFGTIKSSAKPKEDGGDGGGGDDSAPPPTLFKKYKLSDDRSFDSMFFPEKESVLRLVDDFRLKRNKFSLDGFPHKLGLLLFGPPGTGKTTFIKSLATYTSRHIVSIPLSKIKTNQELYDVVFERVFPCSGDDGVPQRLKFDEIIFVMEDVDAASDIVKTRRTTDNPAMMSTVQVHESQSFAIFEGAHSADPPEDAQRATPPPPAPSPPPAPEAPETESKVSPVSALKKLLEPVDKLDLAGLLNVLDGVVDSPGRIVIMTTNHPEMLDPALIRPGRINMKLCLTYVKHEVLEKMVAHHYGPLTSEQSTHLREVFDRRATGTMDEEPLLITPAEVEQLCAEHDTIAEFIAGFERFPELPPALAH